VLIALGSNLGPREWMLRSAIHRLSPFVRIVRVSGFHETDAVDAPAGSPQFLNVVAAGFTHLVAHALLAAMLAVEQELGRVRRGHNAPRTLDLDLILYGATLMRTGDLTLPHPRYLVREFVMGPLRELRLPWCDPVTGRRLDA
jgi:2-amino-4-hydroxy-6-hydroxymethyldihydropteridine diphosphokinase